MMVLEDINMSIPGKCGEKFSVILMTINVLKLNQRAECRFQTADSVDKIKMAA